MRISDFIIKKLELSSFKTCFMVTGGGALFLNDALFKNKKIKKIFCHHEQACSIAAESYYRNSLNAAIVQVTTGPATINSLNGVYGAFVDSIPMFVLSGQVRTDNISYLYDENLRQFGDQEVKTEFVVKSITKKVITLKTSNIIKINHLVDELVEAAFSGRKGPVWLDVPIDIQGKLIDDKKLAFQLLKEKKKDKNLFSIRIYEKNTEILLKKIKNSKKPVIICGNGVRFSNSINLLSKVNRILQLPILTVWNSHDIIPNTNKYYCGRPGMDGERAGNFVVQNCDLLIILGARMHVRQVGFNHKKFAPNAFKIMVDIDKSELNKKNLSIDLKINAELNYFLRSLLIKINGYETTKSHKSFLEWARKNLTKFPVFQKKFLQSKNNKINPYVFLKSFFEKIDNKSTIVTGDGTAAVVTFKIAFIKKHQRLFTNKGSASMGYDLPALLGAITSNKNRNRKFYCITGDGSIMMNLQELETLKSLKDNFTIFILNNDGYHSIRQTQKNFFDTEIGCGPKSDLSFPNFSSIAKAFGYKYSKIQSIMELKKLDEIVKNKEKNICEIFIDKRQLFEPRLVSYKDSKGNLISPPLHDMTPRLSKKDLENSMYKNEL